jgi:hypothetical protein
MDQKIFELLLRRKTLLSQIWECLNTLDRVELLLRFAHDKRIPPVSIQTQAVQDANPVVRMLAAHNKSYFFERGNPEMHAKLLEDKSPLVQAAMNADIDFKDLFKLSQLERLGVISLSSSINEEKFAAFIVDSLQKQLMTEEEAASLLVELVRNPNLKPWKLNEGECFEDGLMWHTNWAQFKAIWNLTVCTPPKVHMVIAWEYPLETGGDDSIPEEMLYQMSEDALEALIWRLHKPLIDLVKKTPERFTEKIHKAISTSTELSVVHKTSKQLGENDPCSLMNDLRTDMHDRLDKLEEKIEGAISKRRGFFG